MEQYKHRIGERIHVVVNDMGRMVEYLGVFKGAAKFKGEWKCRVDAGSTVVIASSVEVIEAFMRNDEEVII